MGEPLIGKREIRAYVRRSWKTIAEWIITKNFPARKIDGVWESDTGLISEWKRNQIIPSK